MLRIIFQRFYADRSSSIAFGVCLYKKKQNVGAIIEWSMFMFLSKQKDLLTLLLVIGFIFTFYVFSFFIDLRPSVGTHVLPAAERREHDQELQRRRTEEEMMSRNGSSLYGSGVGV